MSSKSKSKSKSKSSKRQSVSDSTTVDLSNKTVAESTCKATLDELSSLMTYRG